jgi:23S rRNA (uracil1939-C5)-methyltransferase
MNVKLESGQRLHLILESMDRLGDSIAHYEGNPVFVFGGIPGEEVIVEVVKHRRQYIAAQVVEVLASSPYRVVTPCSYVGDCTGCQWQHISYEHQLYLKKEAVINALDAVNIPHKINVFQTIPSSDQFGYRNHARFTVGKEGRLGFVHRERRRFVDVQQCLLMDPWINRTLDTLQGLVGETTQLSMRYGRGTEDWLIQPTLKSADIPIETGQKYYREDLMGTSFRVAASSFFQTNTKQAEALIRLVIDNLSLTGREVLVDLYAGVGTFAAVLAPYVSKVIVVEESASATGDAKQNLSLFDNIEIWTGKTEDVLGGLKIDVDVAIIDPPRVGCHPRTLDSLMALSPSKLIYISCDPVSLARDLKQLSEGPYKVEFVQPVDMFPQTYHVECIALLTLKSQSKSYKQSDFVEGEITLASSSIRRIEILDRAQIAVRVISPPDIEPVIEGPPEIQVAEKALAKARSVAKITDSIFVIGADTLVVDGDIVIGKPGDRSEAISILKMLKGRSHRVLTGVAILDRRSGLEETIVQETFVNMRSYTENEMDLYIALGACYDKAGSYGIQDAEFNPVDSIKGCYLNVVGFPLCSAISLMRKFGLMIESIVLSEDCRYCRLYKESQ